jgi:rsbT co-antagonist protein RsbR
VPILEIWDDVLALPLIGVLDSKRSADIMDRLLQDVSAKGCQYVILDLTGIDLVDTATADVLIRIMKSVGLLGARCVVTGIRPAVAQTFVSLGIELGSFDTLRNLKQALRYCMNQTGGRLERRTSDAKKQLAG